MSISSIRPTIVSWIRSVTGFGAQSVIWKNQNIGRPAKPYIELFIGSSTPDGSHDYKFPPNAAGSGTIVGNRELPLSIQIFSPNIGEPGYIEVLDVLERIRQSVDIDDVYQTLISAGIAFVDTLTGPTDISQVLDREFEPRGLLDILLRIPYTSEDASQGVIEHVRIEGTIKDVAGEIVSHEITEIPEP